MKKPIITATFISIVLAASGCEIDLKENAEAQGAQWVQEMDLGDARVVCVNNDTDGDGYVSCMLKQGEKFTPIECVGSSYTWNSGCRAPKLKIPTPVHIETGE